MVPVQRYIVCKDKHQKPIISEDKTSYVWHMTCRMNLKKHLNLLLVGIILRVSVNIFFEINENKIRAKSSESQLYLAYLYLAQKKA
ncbi:Uncharacterised protein [Legionella feeleii]|uniref:Uncharacterized protein n=2 Tax=Legionella feeleii TaxID=453 RepID=A0A2X1SV23_9GAMM|nr:Uncharacterised protein [Legionella feeleii]